MSADDGAGGETSWYSVLGARPDASPDELRRCYHAAALGCHPDKNPGDAEAAAAFQRVQAAWTVLSDAPSRREYDAAQAVAAGQRISAEVDLDDLTFEEEAGADGDDLYTWPCRCGWGYKITTSMLEEGCDVFPCEGCSLCIRVMYELASASEEESEEGVPCESEGDGSSSSSSSAVE